MRLARELAERIVALEYDTLPAAAVYGSRIAVLDTLGVTLAGSREELETVASVRSLTALLEPVRQVKVSSLAHA